VKTKILIIHLGFALTGIVTTMLDPLLPQFISHWHLNDARAGHLFWFQFVASPAGALIASKVLSRWGATWTVPIGMLLIAGGVSTITVGTIGMVQLGIALYGLGLGFALPSTNLLIVEMVSEKQASALNLLNLSWTLGALAGPYAIHLVDLRWFLFTLAAMVLSIAVIEALAFPKGNVVSADTRHGKLVSPHRLAFALLMFFFMFLYVGIENGFIGWVPTFSIRSQHTSANWTAFVNSSFWAALLAGRLGAPLVLRRAQERSVIIAGLAISALGIVLAVVSPSLLVLEIGVLLSGLGMAAIFPTAIAIFTEWYGTGGAGSAVLGLCGLGGAVVPWLVGVVSYRSQNLRLGLSVTLACTAISALLLWRISNITREQSARAAARTS
jgi:MFS transporter, FHS family, glucose/mannose:H+ symporter